MLVAMWLEQKKSLLIPLEQRPGEVQLWLGGGDREVPTWFVLWWVHCLLSLGEEGENALGLTFASWSLRELGIAI